MTARRDPLPLAPRPFPGEAPSSWLARVGARYGLPSNGLLAALLDRAGVSGQDRVEAWRLDAQPWPEAERAVAAATRSHPGTIAALRLGTGGTVLWPRTTAVPWCPTCVAEVARQHGEFHLRAEWMFGACSICPRHRRPLRTRCPVCWNETVQPRAFGGRLRLWCGLCGGCTEREMETEAGNMPPRPSCVDGHAGSPRTVMDGSCRNLLVRLQSDLLRAARGRSLMGPWAANGKMDAFVAAVRCLAHVLHHSMRPVSLLPSWHRPHGPVHGMQVGWAPGGEHPETIAGTLAVAAALLAWVRGGPSTRTRKAVWIVVSPGDGLPDRSELTGRIVCRQNDLGRHFTDDEARRFCEAPDAVLREVDEGGHMRETPASWPAYREVLNSARRIV